MSYEKKADATRKKTVKIRRVTREKGKSHLRTSDIFEILALGNLDNVLHEILLREKTQKTV